jgi:hypothetical protein
MADWVEAVVVTNERGFTWTAAKPELSNQRRVTTEPMFDR